MPMKLGHHNMIPTHNGKGVLVIGGDFLPGPQQDDKIYELKCTDIVEDCQWVTIQQKLKYAKKAFVVMLIPDSLANELCLSTVSIENIIFFFSKELKYFHFQLYDKDKIQCMSNNV